MCSPSLRICEKNEYNTAIFQLLEDALNDPAHPLHEKAIANNPFILISDEVYEAELKAEPELPLPVKPIETGTWDFRPKQLSQ